LWLAVLIAWPGGFTFAGLERGGPGARLEALDLRIPC